MFNRWMSLELLRIRNLSGQIKDNFVNEAEERLLEIESEKDFQRESVEKEIVEKETNKKAAVKKAVEEAAKILDGKEA